MHFLRQEFTVWYQRQATVHFEKQKNLFTFFKNNLRVEGSSTVSQLILPFFLEK